RVPGVVAAHDVPVLLHEQHQWPRRVHGDAVDAVTDLRRGIGQVLRVQTFRDHLPGRAAVVGTEGTGSRDGDVDARVIGRIDQDRVQAHTAGAWRPLRPGAVAAQARQFGPRLAAVGRLEQRGVFDAGIHRVGIRQRRLQMPDALEFPWVRRAVVPLRGSGDAGVRKLVADGLPGLAAVVRSLHGLPEPRARLRRVYAIRIDRRAFEVVDLPPAEMRSA